MRTIKSVTVRQLKGKFESMRKAYWGIDGIWSDGYFVSTIGINHKVIRRYIELQGQEDEWASAACFRLLGDRDATR